MRCASSLPCALALVAALLLWLGAHAALQAQEQKRGPLNKNLVQKSARAPSLSHCLLLSCAASLVLPLARAPSLSSQAGTDGLPMADGPDARERGGALLADRARRARGDRAPGAHGDRDGDDGTSSGANFRSPPRPRWPSTAWSLMPSAAIAADSEVAHARAHVHMYRAVTLVKNCRPYSGP